MFNNNTLFELCYIVFDACISKWGISNIRMGNLISNFALTTLIQKNEEYYNSMGVQGIVEEIENHIAKRGGSIYG